MNEHMLTNMMGAVGQGSDTMMAHVTPGDVVIPRDLVLENPEFLTKLKKVMKDKGADYRSHVVGSGYENINPETGAPGFFFSGFKNFFRNPGKTLSNISSDPLGQLTHAVETGVVMGKPIANMARSYGLAPMPEVESGGASSNLGEVETPFKPKRPNEVAKPYDLFSKSVGGQTFSTLSPEQQRSYLATEGTYGAGLGDTEKNYYMNMLQRNLISDSGQLGDMNSLSPIERNYLTRQGLPTGDTLSFFKALQT